MALLPPTQQVPIQRTSVAGAWYRWTRDLHLYVGLFVSPFVLVFAASAIFLVHQWLPASTKDATPARLISGLSLPPGVEKLTGRERINGLKPALRQAGVDGEVGWIQYRPKENQLVIPVQVPGRATTVTIDLARREASVQAQTTGLADALVFLHKMPGPHLVEMRMNWPWLRLWLWLADATVYLLLFIMVSGVYLWYALRSQRRTGWILILAGTISFFGLAYAVIH